MSIKIPKTISLKKIYGYFEKLGLSIIVKESKSSGDLKRDLRFERKKQNENFADSQFKFWFIKTRCRDI